MTQPAGSNTLNSTVNESVCHRARTVHECNDIQHLECRLRLNLGQDQGWTGLTEEQKKGRNRRC